MRQWTPVIDVDFETVVNQDMTPVGIYDVAGVRVYTKGEIWPLSGGAAAAINGPGGGLSMSIAAAINVADRPIWVSQAGFGGNRRVTFIPFSQFSSWDENLPTWVVWRLAGPDPLSNTINRSAIAGIGGMASDLNPITAAEKLRAPSICWFLELNTNPFTYCKGTDALSWTANNLPSSQYEDYQWGILRGLAGAYSLGVAEYAGSLSRPQDADFIVNLSDVNNGRPLYVQYSEPAGTVEAPNMGFFFTMHKPFSDGASFDIRLNKLAIFQPG